MRFDFLPVLAGSMVSPPDGEELRGLPQFFRADLDMVYRLGGPHLRRLMSMPEVGRWTWRYVSVDSRLHMLMGGMWPCIPGWHCDDFYRPPATAPSPDLENVCTRAPSVHASIVFGGCSLTEFLAEPLTWTPRPRDPRGPLYRRADAFIRSRRRKTIVVKPGEIWRFSPLTWHRGNPATRNGWRYFLRITGSEHYEPRNELRTQTQVYLTEPFAGW